jgi:hypothetical protein
MAVKVDEVTRMQAETRAAELGRKEPKASGLTFAAKPCAPCIGHWYVAGFFKGEEVAYVRD